MEGSAAAIDCMFGGSSTPEGRHTFSAACHLMRAVCCISLHMAADHGCQAQASHEECGMHLHAAAVWHVCGAAAEALQAWLQGRQWQEVAISPSAAAS